MSKNKYCESDIISNVQQYIDSTYGQHYQSKSIQLIDLFESEGMVIEYLKTSVMRYVLRFGKKEGSNIKDLYKAIHCIILLIYFTSVSTDTKNSPQLLQE